MSATAKIFMHGRSQAVRLPKEFRFAGSEVRVSRDGDKVILEPITRSGEDIASIWARIDALSNGEALFPSGWDMRALKVGDRVILEPLDATGPMPWALIDQTGDSPFMPDGREQPDMPADREAFDP